MKKSDFVHLHVHTTRSMLDGFTHMPDLCDTVKGLGQRAVAITDHGNLSGVPALWKEAKRTGIKPIAGLEAYICEDRLEKGGGRSKRSPYYHITLLARNLKGYANLCRLSTLSYVEGFYSKPRIDMTVLNKYSEGITILSGCVGGWPQQLILGGDKQAARRVVADMRDIFGEHFYLETQLTGEPDQKIVLKEFLSLVKKDKHKLILTGDSHYTKKEDYKDHDVLFCMGLHKQQADPDRMKFQPGQYYIKSADEMASLGLPKSALLNSVEVAENCDNYALPRAGGFPKVKDAAIVLEAAATEGLMRRVPDASDEYWERLFHEMSTISELSFDDYFLIAHSIMEFAREKDMVWSWGRGSAVGSLVSYSLGITQLDPIKYNLLFERFLNSERRNPPDIDLDFTDYDRQRIVEFVQKKYGKANVAHIATFAGLGPRQVIIDTCKVLGKPQDRVYAVLQALTRDPSAKVKDILEDDVQRDIIEQNLGKEVPHYMERFAGIPRNASVHAAGLIIDSEPLDTKMPMLMPRGKQVLASQYVYDDLVPLGFEKFDVLGVRTLRTMRDCAKDVGVDVWNVPLNDKKTYELLSNGFTVGVFQLESYGYRQFLKEFRPRNFEDVMLANALYRPGPMQGGRGLGELIARRFGKKVEYHHPSLKPILQSTYGLMIFQEQVMAVVRALAGWSMGEADALRAVVAKKKLDKIAAMRTKFIKDCRKMKHSKEFAEKMFDEIEFFGRYGWNRAHAAAYGMVTYVCAYLKANHTASFMTCTLNSETDGVNSKEKINKLVRECTRLGLRVKHPLVNDSNKHYRVMQDDRGDYILAGLAAIKFLGEKGVEAILAARRKDWFASVEDFRNRVPKKLCNSLAMKSLQTAKAFQGLPKEGENKEVYL